MEARLAGLTGVPALVLLAAGPLLAQEEGGGLLAISPGLVVWTWVIFLLLLFVLWKWAWPPMLKALEARENRIQEALDQAARDREEAQRLLDEQRRLLNDARNEAQEILAEGRRAAERLRSEMLEEAREEQQEIIERARVEIGRERDEALDALRREAVDLSIRAASRVLEKNLDAEENRRLALEYLDRLVEERAGNGSGGGA